MMGLDGTITPSYSGRIIIIAQGALGASPNCTIQIHYGTGVKPVNGAPLAGTAVVSWIGGVSIGAGDITPWSTSAIVTGLTVGTAYWLDVVLAAAAGSGACAIYEASITAHEF